MQDKIIYFNESSKVNFICCNVGKTLVLDPKK